MILARIWKRHYVISGLRRVPKFVAPQDLGPQYIEPHTLNPAGGMGKRKIDHLISQPHRFENLGTLVGLQGRDTHFPHHFHDSFGNATAVGFDHRLVAVERIGQLPLPARLP